MRKWIKTSPSFSTEWDIGNWIFADRWDKAGYRISFCLLVSFQLSKVYSSNVCCIFWMLTNISVYIFRFFFVEVHCEIILTTLRPFHVEFSPVNYTRILMLPFRKELKIFCKNVRCLWASEVLVFYTTLLSTQHNNLVFVGIYHWEKCLFTLGLDNMGGDNTLFVLSYLFTAYRHIYKLKDRHFAPLETMVTTPSTMRGDWYFLSFVEKYISSGVFSFYSYSLALYTIYRANICLWHLINLLRSGSTSNYARVSDIHKMVKRRETAVIKYLQ